ncbi:hypothetical protein OX283_004125 [Flavobacterium sp. SUN052]|uniref:hypothetical protein n=1 Tax=Flavobacterium sp. SUN052 TaxID=3002441 RepID=UPI00237E936C|nr:hypothetical protein [Flavobacterium sp. SUN052]MEC4003832.1 hypothetical protein [Flavobacterium sp. SUN052]
MIDFIVNDRYFILKLIFGLASLFLGVYQNFKIDFTRKNGILVSGKIINYFEKIDELSDYQKKYYYPIIEFKDSNDVERKIIDYSFGTTIKPKKILPHKINLYYIQKNEQLEIITENNWNNFVPMLFLIIGIIVTLTTLFYHFYK